MTKPDSQLPKLPSIGDLMMHPRVQGVVERINQTTLARRATGFLDEVQTYLRQRAGNVPSLGELAERFAHHLLGEGTISTPIINATGVVLGSQDMVPALADEAVQQMQRLAGDFHEAGSMQTEPVGRLLCELTGAEAVWVAGTFDGANHLLQSTFGDKHETAVAEFAGLTDPAEFGLGSIPTVKSHLDHCDLVLFNGSGMLGGPTCGILAGSQCYIDELAKHPLATILRANSLTMIALETTLNLYRQDERIIHQIPTLRLLSTPLDNLKQRAERLAPQMQQCPAIEQAQPIQAEAVWGRSTDSQYRAPTWTIELLFDGDKGTKDPAPRLLSQLRDAQWPVFGRSINHRIVLDLRTVFPRWDQHLAAAVEAL